ncbi:hypothetical protein KPH14_009932 [Odynerus spinipes]|uniref:Uncharacterized protein n=1 Tax=Odynerus spinipes TaxID=1348599 RepID=A0AAD9VT85_9HYME|nr:hypothetical protein KPH14_009932 [Odynerus spinipes]
MEEEENEEKVAEKEVRETGITSKVSPGWHHGKDGEVAAVLRRSQTKSAVKFVPWRKIFFLETNSACVVHDECASGLMPGAERRMPQVSHVESAKASSLSPSNAHDARPRPLFVIFLFSPCGL